MKEIPLPASREAQQKIKTRQKRKCTAFTVLFYVFTAVAVLSLIGIVVTALVFELKEETGRPIFGILFGSSFAGGVVFGTLFAVLFSKLLRIAEERFLDFSERCDSPESFFVGEGTLATFGENALLLHGEEKKGKEIRIPYAEIRLFSVCTRRAPREKGEWSVVFELPSRYLSKEKTPRGEKVLVQADAKERLLATIGRHSLPLLGEKKSKKKGKFTLRAKYYQPIAQKRTRSLVIAIVGGAIGLAGVPAAIFWQPVFGSILAVLGIFAAARGTLSFFGAKHAFFVYEEGIFYRDADGRERTFLKWEEIGRLSRDERGGSIKAVCAYGSYHLPDIAGVYDYLKELHPDKCA